MEALERALAVSRATGLSFVGPWILGQLALVVDDPKRRRDALEEGERILQTGAPAHNHFWFYTFAIEVAVASGSWAEAERYAAALEAYTSAESTLWSQFFATWGRLLAAHGRGARDEVTRSRLAALRHQAAEIGFRFALPPLQAALAS
jgi:hypothetical protein